MSAVGGSFEAVQQTGVMLVYRVAFTCMCGRAWRWENVPAGATRNATHTCPAPLRSEGSS